MPSLLVRSMTRVLSALAAVAAVTTGCSASSPGASSGADVTATGTIGGKAFEVGSVVAVSTSGTADKMTPSIAIYVGTGSQFSSCAQLTKDESADPANATSFFFTFTNGGDPLLTGTYSLTDKDGATGRTFVAESVITDAQCNDSGINASAGTVSVSAVSATSVSGTYDLTFDTDHVRGAFDVTAFCALPNGSNVQPTCQP
jgi:hypothetical protein